MNFNDFINLYGNMELNIEPLKMKDGKLFFSVNGNGTDNDGNTNFFYFIISGNFKLMLLKCEDGWELDNSITTFKISKIEDKENVYAVQEYLGAYIEFSVDNCVIEELSYKAFIKRIKKIQ
ncbi:MAG: hypothetical protein ACI4MB_06140 [Candidatus Coproplasma sp.]